MLPLPDALVIGAQEYKVSLVDRFEQEPKNAWGFCDERSKTLQFAAEFPNERLLLITYFHECIHAIENEYGLDLKEKDVDRLAQGVTQAVLALVAAA